ncbi:MAG: hypothetical protein GF411_10400 [Candidatus Lokiarchaeota archaeon]|nr:hypothetical protein [Candidatus Lokiarchaeota archaeon]
MSELWLQAVIMVGGPVEKFNPLKPSAISQKRERQTDGKWAKQVAIKEITLEDVRHDAIEFGLATEVLAQVKAGKEASIFIAKWKEHPIMLKAYRLWRSAQASNERGVFTLAKMQMLAAKEYDVLKESFQAGVTVPTPIGRVGNYITMRFIGDGLDPAPQLKDVHLENPNQALDAILEEYLKMYRDANYVHGDLSKYNILWWQNRPWIIDVPQAYTVGPWANMKEVVFLLRRDIKNLLSYFKRYGIKRNLDEIVDVFLSEYVPENLRHYDEVVPFRGV